MVLHDVTKATDTVVEAAPVIDAEALRHGDLDAAHVIAIPQWLEHGIGEPQVKDVLHGELSEEVVDPVELRLVQNRAESPVELLRRLEVVTERLLDHDTRILGEPGCGEALHHGTEQRRRDLQVEHRHRGVADGSCDGGERRRIAEVASDVGHPLAEPRENFRVRLGVTERGGDRL